MSNSKKLFLFLLLLFAHSTQADAMCLDWRNEMAKQGWGPGSKIPGAILH